MAKIGRMSIARLRKELARKEQQVARLTAKKEDLLKQIADVDGQIEAIVGKGADRGAAPKAEKPASKQAGKRGTKRRKKQRRGGRPKLAETIKEILQEAKEPMGANDIAEALKARKFKTRSKNLVNLVREALTRVKGVRRVSRGQYTA